MKTELESLLTGGPCTIEHDHGLPEGACHGCFLDEHMRVIEQAERAREGQDALREQLAAANARIEKLERAVTAGRRLRSEMLELVTWHNFDGPNGSDLCICVTEDANYPNVTRPEKHEDFCESFRGAYYGMVDALAALEKP